MWSRLNITFIVKNNITGGSRFSRNIANSSRPMESITTNDMFGIELISRLQRFVRLLRKNLGRCPQAFTFRAFGAADN